MKTTLYNICHHQSSRITMDKECTKCGISKTLEEFPNKRATKASVCKACQRLLMQSHYRSNAQYYKDKAKAVQDSLRDYVIKAKQVPCADCGKQFHYCAMDFDHLRDKEFTIAKMHTGGSLRRVIAEIAKCEVVCAVCHRIRTFNRMHS